MSPLPPPRNTGAAATTATTATTGLAAPLSPPLPELQQALQALQAQGAASLDPVGFHLLQGLARRAAGLQGPAQAWVAQRLSLHLARCQARVAEAGRARDQPPAHPAGRTGPSPLAVLLQRLAAAEGAAPGASVGPAPGPATPAGRLTSHAQTAASARPGATPAPAVAPAGLRAVQRFQGTWQRLHADQQIRRSLAKRPEGSGPLNSHRLVLQALQTLQTLSPAYLERFVGQLDAWAWLSQVPLAALAPPPAASSPPEAERKRRPAKPRAG